MNFDLNTIAKLSGQFGLPLHIYSKLAVRESADGLRKIIERLYPYTQMCFAAKSNPCRGAIQLVSELGLGVDCVSEHELQTALEEGIPADRIICNGNAKTDHYLSMIAEHSLLTAVDNMTEMEILDELASRRKSTTPILIRLSGMPLEGLTSADQTTAGAWTKFGFHFSELEAVLDSLQSFQHLRFAGYSAHIGTQICSADGYDRLMEYLFKASETATQMGLAVKHLNIGGGFPLNYLSEQDWLELNDRLKKQLRGETPTDQWVTWENIPAGYAHLNGRKPTASDEWRGKAYWTAYPGAKMLERLLTKTHDDGKTTADKLRDMGAPKLIVEPGRALFSSAGITVARVTAVKQVLGNNVIDLDMGIVNHSTNLVSPDMFPVEILPHEPDEQPAEVFLAGRLCFTGDMIAKIKIKVNRLPNRGDLAVIKMTGAYSADHFASNSCGFPRPAKIALDDVDRIEIWRQGEVFDDVFAEIKVVNLPE